MTDLNDNQFEDFEEEPTPPGEPRPAGNRNFIIAIGVLGGISLLILIVLIIVGLVILPAQSKARKEQAALVNAQNTATSQAATQIAAVKAMATATPTSTATAIPSATPVIAIATATAIPQVTGTPGTPVVAQDLSARTQTVAALLTQAAGGNGTATATPKTTALPTTGFADEVGLPVLLGLALLLVVVIFVARRLRFSSSS
jgi:LPXTG-motif cell wall-anchored protein